MEKPKEFKICYLTVISGASPFKMNQQRTWLEDGIERVMKVMLEAIDRTLPNSNEVIHIRTGKVDCSECDDFAMMQHVAKIKLIPEGGEKNESK